MNISEKNLTETYIDKNGGMRIKTYEYKNLGATRKDTFYTSLDNRGLVISKHKPDTILSMTTGRIQLAFPLNLDLCRQYLFLKQNKFIKKSHTYTKTENGKSEKVFLADAYYKAFYYIENQALIIPLTPELKEQKILCKRKVTYIDSIEIPKVLLTLYDIRPMEWLAINAWEGGAFLSKVAASPELQTAFLQRKDNSLFVQYVGSAWESSSVNSQVNTHLILNQTIHNALHLSENCTIVFEAHENGFKIFNEAAMLRSEK